jgi:hypothetical protein
MMRLLDLVWTYALGGKSDTAHAGLPRQIAAAQIR